MRITLSKAQWEFIGGKTGWIKTSQTMQQIKTPTIHPMLPIEDNRLPKWVKNIVEELKTFATVLRVSYNKMVGNASVEFTPVTHSMGADELKKLHEICSRYRGKFSTINDRSVLLFR